MQRYFIEPWTRKYAKRYGFLSFARKYKKQLLHTGLDKSSELIQATTKSINSLEQCNEILGKY